LEEARPRRVHVLNGQWDETVQQLRTFVLKKRLGEIESQKAASAQIMMQHYVLLVMENMGIKSREPYFVKAFVCMCTTADVLVEGLLRGMPFRFDDCEVLWRLISACDDFVLVLAFDRASANWSIVRWLWETLLKPGMPMLLPHAEPCSLHGKSLVLRSPSSSKEIEKKTHTFGAWMRFWRNGLAIKDAAVQIISSEFKTRYVARPPDRIARTEQIIAAVYPNFEQEDEDVGDGAVAPKRRGGRRQKKTTHWVEDPA